MQYGIPVLQYSPPWVEYFKRPSMSSAKATVIVIAVVILGGALASNIDVYSAWPFSWIWTSSVRVNDVVAAWSKNVGPRVQRNVSGSIHNL